MRGQIKLEVDGVIIARDHFQSDSHRDIILRFWKKDYSLKDLTYCLIISPDDEEIERTYDAERARRIYRGRFKRGSYPGAEGRKEEIRTGEAYTVDVGAASSLVPANR